MGSLAPLAAGLALAALPLGLGAGPVFDAMTATPTLTATATPTAVGWSTPPAGAQGSGMGSAIILGNIFHPLQGGDLMLQFTEPYEAAVDIDIYDRLGRLVKHLQTVGGPGTASVGWDGRGDSASMVSSGIYVAHFHGKGLNSLVKFAIVK